MIIAINIWKYEYKGKIKLTDVDGNIFIGDAGNVTDEEEQSADDNRPESSICIYTEDGKVIDFYESEIASIEKVN